MRLNVDPAPLRPRYAGATPFPHVVLDGLFPNETLEEVLAEFPGPSEIP